MSNIICPKCNSTYKYISLLIRHLNTSSRCKTDEEEIAKISNEISNLIKNDKHQKLSNKNNICNHCKYIFTKKSSLIYHQKKSKCGIIQNLKLIAKTKGIDKLTIEQLKLIEPDKYNDIIKQNNQPTSAVTNNINHTNSHNTTNNTNNTIINNNNNINIQYINPFGFEDVRTIPITEMKKILKSGTEAGLHIIKAIYDKIENKNFYKPNLSRPEIACLNEDLKLTIYKSKEFADALFDRCIALLHHMLYLCKNEFTNVNIKYIYENIEHIELTMRTEIYDKKLKNIIESEFRNNNLDTKDRIKNFIKQIKEDTLVKDNSLLQIKNNLDLQSKKNEEYTKILTMDELNKLFGDPRIILGLKKEEIILNLRTSRFEESIFYNFWIDRLTMIKKYVIDNKSKIGDIININNEEAKIMQMLEIIERRVELYRSSAYIDLNINDDFMLYDKFTIEKIKRIEEKKEKKEKEEKEEREEREENTSLLQDLSNNDNTIISI